MEDRSEVEFGLQSQYPARKRERSRGFQRIEIEGHSGASDGEHVQRSPKEVTIKIGTWQRADKGEEPSYLLVGVGGVASEHCKKLRLVTTQ